MSRLRVRAGLERGGHHEDGVDASDRRGQRVWLLEVAGDDFGASFAQRGCALAPGRAGQGPNVVTAAQQLPAESAPP